MAYTITQLKTDLQGMLHGTSLSKVQGVNDLISRAGRELLLDVDPAETRRVAHLPNAVYSDVYDYPAPSDLKGDKVIDIKPLADRQLSSNVVQNFNKEFDLYKSYTREIFAVLHNNGVKYLRLSKSLPAGILINDCESLTEDAVWEGTSQVINLAIDTTNKVTGNAALHFDLLGGGGVASGLPLLLGASTPGATSSIGASLTAAVNLSEHENLSSLFVWVYLESSSSFDSFTLHWGNDTSNYWTRTVTSGHYEPFRDGWNLLRFDWFGATVTGDPDPAAIDFLQVDVTINENIYNLRIDSFYSRLPYYYELVYYSKYLFRSASGTWKEAVTSDDDIVNLDTDSYNLLLNKTMILCAAQVQSMDSAYDANFYREEYINALKNYRSRYRTESTRPRQTYYRF